MKFNNQHSVNFPVEPISARHAITMIITIITTTITTP